MELLGQFSFSFLCVIAHCRSSLIQGSSSFVLIGSDLEELYNDDDGLFGMAAKSWINTKYN